MATEKIGDVLEQLFELKWRDVSVPCTEFDTDLEQDLVAHKWPDRDGAHVEATGRAPLVISATIPFRNFLSPGLAETWNSGNSALYPTVFRAFFDAMATRSSGPLQHPEFGVIQCKPKGARCKWLAQRRDGCDVHATWIESLDDTVSDFEDILARKSPEPLAFVATADLDAQIADYGNPAVTSDAQTGSLSFSDQIAKITSAFDSATLLSSSYAGQIDRVVYRVQALEDRVTAAADVTAWPIVSSCERAKSALYDLKSLLLTSDRNVAIYVAPRDTTLAALTVATGARIDDLLTLNPALVELPYVPRGASVRYYRS